MPPTAPVRLQPIPANKLSSDYDFITPEYCTEPKLVFGAGDSGVLDLFSPLAANDAYTPWGTPNPPGTPDHNTDVHAYTYPGLPFDP
mmetsp:Transcript_47761/g.85296  ORF Transcript_47761/g.85296 Transcript_47761/m.85296 type:complete len:87 (+) Transcript_47761:61-321(+)